MYVYMYVEAHKQYMIKLHLKSMGKEIIIQ